MNYKNLLALSVSVSVSTIFLTSCGGSEPVDEGQGIVENVAELSSEGSSPQSSGAGNVDDARLVDAANEPEQWLTYGGTYNEQRYSQLDQITTENVNELGLSWFADLNTNRGQQSTPLFVDGVLYVTEAWSKVSAYDATSGERLWFYDPMVPGERGGMGCCDVVNRGVAVYEGKVFVGAYDGRLIALDAETGEELWSELTVDQDQFYSVTSAPRVVNGNVILGMAGAEYNTRGYVSSYDAQTGEMQWRFYTVPGNPELGFENEAMRMAADTWTGEWWEQGGGGSTWDSMTFDPETNLILFGVGNGYPWNPLTRSPEGGDNLFTISIVAVDADTGEYVWHFQQIPAEEWDFDAVGQITVADLEIDGEMRHVAMQAAKNGYFYMLDVLTGELIRANNFVEVNWTFGYDMETAKPIINPAAQYTLTDVATIIQPGPQGAHSWHPMSYSQQTGLLYIPAQETSMAFRNAPNHQLGSFALGVDWTGGQEAYDEPGNTIPAGVVQRMVAWDPVAAEEVWAVENEGTGGILTTAGGLLFKGNSGQQEFVAYSAESGERLWSTDIQSGAAPGAISYVLDGEQYIAQVVGGGTFGGYYAPTYARLLVFKLGGDAVLPEKAEFTQRAFSPPVETALAAEVESGREVYTGSCAMCHGDGGANRGMFPDLRRSPLLHSEEGFRAVVLGGILSNRGMISFSDRLTEEEVELIRAYMTSEAHIAMNQPAFGAGGPPPEEEEESTHTTE